MHEVSTYCNEIEAIFEDCAHQGQAVVGWTQNRMRVRLFISDLPFALADCPVTLDNYSLTFRRFHRVSDEQHAAILMALAEKVAASEVMSKSAPAALVYRAGK